MPSRLLIGSHWKNLTNEEKTELAKIDGNIITRWQGGQNWDLRVRELWDLCQNQLHDAGLTINVQEMTYDQLCTDLIGQMVKNKDGVYGRLTDQQRANPPPSKSWANWNEWATAFTNPCDPCA